VNGSEDRVAASVFISVELDFDDFPLLETLLELLKRRDVGE